MAENLLLRQATLDAEKGNGCTAKIMLDAIPSLEERWLTLKQMQAQSKADGNELTAGINLFQTRYGNPESSRAVEMALFEHNSFLPRGIYFEYTHLNADGVQRTSSCEKAK